MVLTWPAQEVWKPVLGITPGDANGIGPEIVVKALSLKEIYQVCHPLVIADAKIIAEVVRFLGEQQKVRRLESVDKATFKHGIIDVLHLEAPRLKDINTGQVNALVAKASVRWTIKATSLALRKEINGIVSGPIHKEALNLAGYEYIDHVELIADISKGKKTTGMLVLLEAGFSVVHVTSHKSLIDACKEITEENVYWAIKIGNRVQKSIGTDRPRIAVAALNPHAGEGNRMGQEEKIAIVPAIREAQRESINVVGPIPADTIFIGAKEKKYDVIIAMYHDQAMIPLKINWPGKIAFVQIGIPIVRTSVTHGPAYDIAGKGLADPKNLIESIKIAAKLAKTKVSLSQ